MKWIKFKFFYLLEHFLKFWKKSLKNWSEERNGRVRMMTIVLCLTRFAFYLFFYDFFNLSLFIFFLFILHAFELENKQLTLKVDRWIENDFVIFLFILFLFLLCFSYESMKSLCDRFNRAIDSMLQMVSNVLYWFLRWMWLFHSYFLIEF